MLQQNDYNCIGILAKHCDLDKLCIAENEAMDFDVAQLYCSNWNDILAIWNEVNEYKKDLAICEADPSCITPPSIPVGYVLKLNLIEGGSYTGCNGKTTTHKGIKRVLTYYSYARYIVLNGFNDTATGFVSKNNEFSTPKTLRELEAYADKYRNMGLITFENTVKFLCANKTVFTWFQNTCEFKCDCVSDCMGTRATGYGLRSSNINKQ